MGLTETNRDKALRGEPVHIEWKRLQELQKQAIACEGLAVDPPVLHWHYAAAMNELVALRYALSRWANQIERAYGDLPSDRFPGPSTVLVQEIRTWLL